MASYIWVVDNNDEVATINTSTLALTKVGYAGVKLTDLAFASDGTLYGISFNELYKVDTATGRATAVGSLGSGISGMNALTISASGVAYAYANNSHYLYTINLGTGAATKVGSASNVYSAGDLAFYDNKLYLTTTTDKLVQLDPSTGKVLATASDNINDLYGLVATDSTHLYGFAGTTMYQLTTSGGHTTLKNYSSTGLVQIQGAAVAPPPKYLWVADANGEIATVNTITLSVDKIGASGAALTDIGFAPNGTLYGISFSELYKINTSTGKATAIGSLGSGINGMNALTVGSNGVAYAYSNNSDYLYKINLSDGEATKIGSASGLYSAGDLTFYNDKLYLSTTTDKLAQIDPSTGKVLSTASDNINNLYGLVATDSTHLYGFSGTTAYQMSTNGGHTTIGNLSGLGVINGAAYNGYFQS